MSDYVPLKPITGPDEPALPPEQAVQPPPKKSKVMVRVLAACGAVAVILVIAMFLGGYLVRNQMKELGLDPELMQTSPALAVAKAMVAANPDVFELVSVDDEKRLITIRNKQTGKTDILDMDAKKVAWTVALPKSKYPEPDPNLIKDTSAVVTISQDNEFFIGRDKVAQADIPTRIRNILKDKRADEQIIYIKSGKGVKYGTVVSVIDAIRDAGFDRIALVAEKD